MPAGAVLATALLPPVWTRREDRGYTENMAALFGKLVLAVAGFTSVVMYESASPPIGRSFAGQVAMGAARRVICRRGGAGLSR